MKYNKYDKVEIDGIQYFIDEDLFGDFYLQNQNPNCEIDMIDYCNSRKNIKDLKI